MKTRSGLKTISIARDFSRYPAGRFRTDGPWSGERFREDYLVPALAEFDQVRVVFDEIAGVGSSFLEEAFGGLVRAGRDKGFLDAHLKLEPGSSKKDYVSLAEAHIARAARAATVG